MSHDYIERAKRVLDIERDAIEYVASHLGESFVGAINSLLETLEKRGKIVIVGVGKSGNIGIKMAATFNSTGATAVVLDTQNALHGDLGLLSEEDTVIAMSYSGETQELVTLLPHLKLSGVKIIAITKGADSTLGTHADHFIDATVEQEACPLRLAPTASSTATLAIGDALAMVLMEVRGFTAESFAKYHPNGSLGMALLTRTEEIMRGGDDMPQVSLNASVMQALDEMSNKRAGACVITNASGGLAGILTHGDFVRSYQEDSNVGEKEIASIMTVEPITIANHLLAAEAVQILRSRKIDDLVVVDSNGLPVGLIDSQDLARHKIL